MTARLRAILGNQPLLFVPLISVACCSAGAIVVAGTAYDGLWKQLPFPARQELFALRATQSTGLVQTRFSEPEYRQLTSAQGHARLAAYRERGTALLNSGQQFMSVTVNSASPSLIPVLGVRASRGRTFTDADVKEGIPVLMISESFRRRLGDTVDSVRLDAEQFEIVGTTPQELDVISKADVWLPLNPSGRSQRRTLRVLARIPASGETGAALGPLSAALTTAPAGAGTRQVSATPVTPLEPGDQRALTAAVVAAVLVIMLTVFNLLAVQLVRMLTRSHQLWLCLALGASRLSVAVTSAVGLSVVVAVGLVLGIAIAAITVQAITRFLGESTVPLVVNPVGSMLTGAVFAVCLVPMVWALTVFVAKLPRQGTTASPAVLRYGRIAVAGQIAFAIMAAGIAFGLTTRVTHLERIDPGFVVSERTHLVTMKLDSAAAGPDESVDAQFALLRRTLDVVKASTGATAVGSVNSAPLGGPLFPTEVSDPTTGTLNIPAQLRFVAGDYWTAMGIPLEQGTAHRSSPVAGEIQGIVSRSLAKQLGSESQLLGRRILTGLLEDHPITVIAVVNDVKQSSLERPGDPTLYLSAVEVASVGDVTVVVRQPADAGRVTSAAVTRAVQQAGLPVAVVSTRPLAEHVKASIAFQIALHRAGVFAAVLLALLSVSGTFAITRLIVRTSVPELAICKAIGASDQNLVARLVVKLRLMVLAGMVGGLALALGGLMFAARMGLIGGRPWLNAALAAGMITIAIMAVAFPVMLRARRVDPSMLLKL